MKNITFAYIILPIGNFRNEVCRKRHFVHRRSKTLRCCSLQRNCKWIDSLETPGSAGGRRCNIRIFRMNLSGKKDREDITQVFCDLPETDAKKGFLFGAVSFYSQHGIFVNLIFYYALNDICLRSGYFVLPANKPVRHTAFSIFTSDSKSLLSFRNAFLFRAWHRKASAAKNLLHLQRIRKDRIPCGLLSIKL